MLWRPCSSPTSSGPPSWPSNWATSTGNRCSRRITASCGSRSSASEAARSTPPATGSSRRFNRPADAIRCAVGDHRPAPRGRDPDPSRGPHGRGRAARQGREARRHRRPHRRARRREGAARPRSSSRARCATSSPAPTSAFADRGAYDLKGVPGEWRLYAIDRELTGEVPAKPIDRGAGGESRPAAGDPGDGDRRRRARDGDRGRRRRDPRHAGRIVERGRGAGPQHDLAHRHRREPVRGDDERRQRADQRRRRATERSGS